MTESPSLLLKVVPTPFAGWRVEVRDKPDLYQFVNKGQAISFAVAWARLHQPCDVEVYGFAGRVERHIRLPRGNRCRGHGPDRRRLTVKPPFPDRRKRERRLPI
jgi:hypothetical protein